MSLDTVTKPEELNEAADYDAMAKDHDRAIVYQQKEQTRLLAAAAGQQGKKPSTVTSRFLQGTFGARGIAEGLVVGALAGAPAAIAWTAAKAVTSGEKPASKFIVQDKNKTKDNSLTLGERVNIMRMGKAPAPRGLAVSQKSIAVLQQERQRIQMQRERVRLGHKTLQEKTSDALRTGDDRPLLETARKNPGLGQRIQAIIN